MLEHRQILLIVDKLRGENTGGLHDRDFDEPWRTIWQRVNPVNDRELAELVVWKAAEGLADRNELAAKVVASMPSAEAFQRFPSHEDLKDRLPAISWLWPGWIPVGLLSLLGAAPGVGKSLVALDLARRIIHNEGFPDGAAVPSPGLPVICVDAELLRGVQRKRAAQGSETGERGDQTSSGRRGSNQASRSGTSWDAVFHTSCRSTMS